MRPVSAPSDRESLLAEIKTLSAPAFDTDALSKRGTSSCPRTGHGCCRAPRWCARRNGSFETGSIDEGRCPLCGQKVDRQDAGAENRERARGRDGSVSRPRALSRSGRPAGGRSRGGARQDGCRFTIARAPWSSSCRPLPALPHAGLQRQRRRARARRDRRDHELLCPRSASGTGRLARWLERRRPPEPSTRDTQLVMLAALCQQVNAWRLAEKKADASSPRAGPRRARLRRLSEEAEGRPGRALDADQPPGRRDLLRRFTRARTSMR